MAENDQTPAAPEPDNDTTVIPADQTTEAPAVPGTAPAPVTETASAGPRLRDTVWNFRSMLAVAAASLVLGGLGGAAIQAVAADDGGPDRVRMGNIGGQNGPGRYGNDDGDGQTRQRNQNGPQNGPDDVTPGGPGTTPESDSGSAG